MNSPEPEWKKEFWPIIRGLVCIVCPRCQGFECHFCEAKGFIYVNQGFKRYHEKVESFISSLLASQRREVLEEAAKVARNFYADSDQETYRTAIAASLKIALAIRALNNAEERS